MKHTHHHFLITLAIMVVVLVSALYFYMRISVANMTESAIDSLNQVAELKSSGKGETVKPRKLDHDPADDWARLFGSFVPVDNAVPFIEMVESIGSSTDSIVTITSIDNANPEDGSPAINGYLNAKVTIRGSWSSVVKAIGLIENMPYKVTINNLKLDLSNGGNNKTSPDWVAAFDMKSVRSI